MIQSSAWNSAKTGMPPPTSFTLSTPKTSRFSKSTGGASSSSSFSTSSSSGG
eukprot:CAMPEP_0117527918 /NCGR_PEP_ID=MMETSP0784-20121206/37047_1 /TAXON_ID=39447 /ORGANISM="" /LENGTH=51 /DNA_ID=CAMNT_0005324189 /DNA_START=19 /DNA_END=171 /DNA_ORIENTATION=-